MPKPEWVQRCSQRLVVPVQAMAVSGSYDLKSNVPRELTPLCHWMGRRGGGAERERERDRDRETDRERQRQRAFVDIVCAFVKCIMCVYSLHHSFCIQ